MNHSAPDDSPQESLKPRDALTVFRRALAKETHVLTQRPGLLWQQLYNRLQWEDGAIQGILRPHLEQRSMLGVPPWIRTRIPPPESAGLIRTLQGPKESEAVFQCAFSRDGSRVISRNSVWDSETGLELPALLDHPDMGWLCGMSGDHGRLITVEGGLCKVREAGTGQEVATCRAHDFQAHTLEGIGDVHFSRLRACAVSPNGSKVVTGCAKFYAVWDADTGEVLDRTPGNGYLPGCAFSPDGNRVATTDDSGGCVILTLGNEPSEPRRTRVEIREGLMTDCAFSPDGTRLVTATTEGPSIVWNVETGSRSRVLEGHTGAVFSCEFSPDGSRVVTGGKDGTCRIWDVRSGEALAILVGHTRGVAAGAFSPDGNRVVTATTDGLIKIWHVPHIEEGLTAGEASGGSLPRGGPVQAIAFTSDGPRAASVLEDRCRIWNLETGKEISRVREGPGRTLSLAFSPDGLRVAVGTGNRGFDGRGMERGEYTCTIWDLEQGEELAVLAGHTDEVTSCAFSPDGMWVVTGSADFTCRVWNIATAEVVAISEKHGTRVAACAVSPTGTSVASTSSGACKIWDPATGQGIGSLYGHKGDVKACAFSPDGSLIVTGSKDTTCKVWDAAARKEMVTLRGHTESIEACIFTPDGNRIVSASKDRTLRVWDAKDGGCIGVFPLLGDARVVAHHPTGPSIACGDSAGAAYLVEVVGLK